MSSRICSVSIDMDTLACYAQIHGLAPSSSAGPVPLGSPPDPIYTHALPRFLAMFDEYNIRATLFVIGKDAEHPVHAEILRDAAARGHELANHSYNHLYRLTRLSSSGIAAEISRGADVIEPLLSEGKKVVGFRCPGYNITPEVLKSLRAQGYLYDSSIFPCPLYYLAKATVIGWLALRRRPSLSIVGSPQVLLSPNHPYQPGFDPHRPAPSKRPEGLPLASRDIWELPMTVLPGIRLPFIGTSVLMYPQWMLSAVTRGLTQTQPFLNFELHGIDMMDPNDPGTQQLRPHQPDLRVSLKEKEQRFHNVFQQIAKTHRFCTLQDAVTTFATQDGGSYRLRSVES